jgi:hypothetical protein
MICVASRNMNLLLCLRPRGTDALASNLMDWTRPRPAFSPSSPDLDLSCNSNDVSVLSTRGIRYVDKVVITRGNLEKGYTDVSTRARMCV